MLFIPTFLVITVLVVAIKLVIPSTCMDRMMLQAQERMVLYEQSTSAVVRVVVGHSNNYVNSVAFSPGGHMALAGNRDRIIKLS